MIDPLTLQLFGQFPQEVGNNDDGLIGCLICGKRMRLITGTHLKSHGVSVEDYRQMFPGCQFASVSFADGLKQKWKDPDYREKQERTLYKRVTDIHRSRVGKTLEEIYGEERGKLIRQKLSDSHKGYQPSDEARARMSASISGKNHPLYGKRRSSTQRAKHSASMRRLFEEGKLNGDTMMRIAKGDNPAENTFAILHPELERQACIVLPTDIIIRERQPGTDRGGLLRFFVDFLDREKSIVYEIDGTEHRTDITKREKDGRRDRILQEIGFEVVRVSSESILKC